MKSPLSNYEKGRNSLFVGLSLEETDEHDGHVVAAQPAHGAVGGEAVGHQLLADDLGLLALAHPPVDEIRDLKRGGSKGQKSESIPTIRIPD